LRPLKSTDDPKDPLDDVEITVLGVIRGRGDFLQRGLRNLKKLGTVGHASISSRIDGVALHPSGEAAVADTGNHGGCSQA